MKIYLDAAKRGIMNGFSVTAIMAKVIIPCYILIEFIKFYDLITPLANFFKPFMRLFDLPGEAAFGLIAGFFINLYAAIAVLSPLNLSSKDITVCALILGICHSLLVETPVTKKAGVNYLSLLLLRIFLGFFSGLLLSLLWKT
ncbi:MAG: nucleoside recognition protein [Desulfobacterota bacterium]|nr:nucleoside recognition protein [Thermodesulfobacteriota bacterium]MDW8002834.1 nucleoside recognition domain-containing protein [Deltaproteobacteria bacterium]